MGVAAGESVLVERGEGRDASGETGGEGGVSEGEGAAEEMGRKPA